MTRYRVDVSELAESDLRVIIRYISAQRVERQQIIILPDLGPFFFDVTQTNGCQLTGPKW